jgi:hypothetical protein
MLTAIKQMEVFLQKIKNERELGGENLKFPLIQKLPLGL